jgi:hypothetical protein
LLPVAVKLVELGVEFNAFIIEVGDLIEVLLNLLSFDRCHEPAKFPCKEKFEVIEMSSSMGLIVLVVEPSNLTFTNDLLGFARFFSKELELFDLVDLEHFLPFLLVSELDLGSRLFQLFDFAPDIFIEKEVPFVVEEPSFDHLSELVYLHEFVFHDEEVEMELAPVHNCFGVVSRVLEDLDVAAKNHGADLHPTCPEHAA